VPSYHFIVLKECSFFLPRAFTSLVKRDSLVACFGEPEEVSPEEGEGKEGEEEEEEEEGGGGGERRGIKFKKDE